MQKEKKKNPAIPFILLQDLWQHPAAYAWNQTDKQRDWKRRRKQTNSKPQTEGAVQADLCLASHRRDTRLSLTGIKEESCPHLPVVSHPTHRNLSATLMLWIEGATGNVSEEKKVIERERVIMEMIIRDRAHLWKQATAECTSDMILFSVLAAELCNLWYKCKVRQRGGAQNGVGGSWPGWGTRFGKASSPA